MLTVGTATTQVSDLICLSPGTRYLNYAQRGPALRSAVKAAEVHYGPSSNGSADSPAELRTMVADLIGAGDPAGIVFTSSTTAGINLVAAGLPWKDGDEIIVSDLEHLGNLAPWLALQDGAGVRVRVASTTQDGLLLLSSVKSLVNSKTRLVAFPHLSHLYGTLQPAAEICQWLQSRNIWSLVDGAQAVGRVSVDVGEINCDFYAFAAGKALMSLPGLGVLYLRPDNLAQLRPQCFGKRNVRLNGHSYGLHPQLVSGPERLEAMPPSAPLLAGLRAALEQIECAGGMQLVEEQVRDRGEQVVQVLESFNKPLLGGRQRRAGMVAWPMPAQEAQELVCRLALEKNIWLGAGQFGARWALQCRGMQALVRVSPHYLTAEQELTDLVRALRDLGN